MVDKGAVVFAPSKEIALLDVFKPETLVVIAARSEVVREADVMFAVIADKGAVVFVPLKIIALLEVFELEILVVIAASTEVVGVDLMSEEL